MSKPTPVVVLRFEYVDFEFLVCRLVTLDEYQVGWTRALQATKASNNFNRLDEKVYHLLEVVRKTGCPDNAWMTLSNAQAAFEITRLRL